MATVLVLVVLLAFALRGHLPGATPAPARARTDSPLSLLALVVLLAVALTGFAFAVITAPRKQAQPAAADLGPPMFGEMRVQLRWRWVLFALVVLLSWLIVVVLIVRLTAPTDLAVPSAPPASPSTAVPPRSPGQRPPDTTGTGSSALGYLAAATVIMLLVVVFGTIMHSRRMRSVTGYQDSESEAPSQRPGGPERLVRAAELGLEEIADLSRDPRTAIIACYAAMERGLAHAPAAVPQDSDTPSEVLARAVRHHALSADSATELVELFTEARFSPHVMTENHRDTAVRALHRVLAELRSLS
ncbi:MULTISPECIES: DUF4129 domain-containing protein [unclassified Mycolicibacterium]|uniref:DUF4129 domain-containing protein n=2 Tax=Mycolicibacterium TaxID=1866885 RepID=UPI00281499CA|nr:MULTISPECIES: DUF4129 domain-containing protein [unclassified Mycolicibacterium]